MPNAQHAVAALAAAISIGLIACSSSPDAPPPTPARAAAPLEPIPLPTLADAKPRDYPGIHNAVAYHEGYISGSVPEGDAGFDTLAAMGVKTIISVDGAVPEVDRAAARGIRYIHLPIGYNGFEARRGAELARASRDALAQGPVYIHCHHGKHRSAGAAASVAASLGWLSPEGGVARMKVSGTAPNYTGLYACAANSTVLGAAALEAVPADFPAVSKPSGYVAGMVEMDEVFEHLKAIEKAGWKTPADHPDLVPVAEAGRLADLYRTLAATEYSLRKPAGFVGLMHAAQAEAQALEDDLAAGAATPAVLSAHMKRLTASCKDCHTKHRD